MNLEQLTSDLLDSKRFCDLLAGSTGLKKRSLTHEDKIAMLVPLIRMIQGKLIDSVGEQPAPRRVNGPAQAPVIDKTAPEVPAFEMGDLGTTHGLPFDPFAHPKEPDPTQVMLGHGKMLADALAALPEAPIGQRCTFTMPMDWNAPQAPFFFEAAIKDGSPWSPVENGVRLGSEKVEEGKPRADAWTVTVIRTK